MADRHAAVTPGTNVTLAPSHALLAIPIGAEGMSTRVIAIDDVVERRSPPGR